MSDYDRDDRGVLTIETLRRITKQLKEREVPVYAYYNTPVEMDGDFKLSPDKAWQKMEIDPLGARGYVDPSLIAKINASWMHMNGTNPKLLLVPR